MKELADPLSPHDGQKVDPKIVIVEFGDFNCPKCKKAMPIVRQVMAKYGADVELFWRNFPIISESSLDLARTGVCANEQGKFWLFHDLIYSGGVSGASALNEALPTIGIDMAKLTKCLSNKLTTAQIKKDYYIGQDAAVGGTPAFFVNGYKIQGVIPFDQWEIIIKKFLSVYEKNAGN
jgi:protein-disulfide isomerase